nr:M43 family zinc metalloprotease [Polaribacter cellanae]
MYLYDDSVGGGGLANGVGESSEFYVSGSYWKAPNNSLTRSHVISHEMGHVLFLWHTHHGTYDEGGNDNPCPELVNGSNSTTCGDYVTDTPADPYLDFDVNQSTCEWNSSGADANGDSYNPDEKNVMSYTDVNCMEYFTEGQGERMRNAINTLPYLKQTVTDNCLVQKLSSIEQLCYANSQTLTISNIPTTVTTTWQVSSNVTILSSNNNSITIRASSSNSTGNSWVKATLSNGTILRENFEIQRTFNDISKISIKNKSNFMNPNILYTNGYLDSRSYWNWISLEYDNNSMIYQNHYWELRVLNNYGISMMRNGISEAIKLIAARGSGLIRLQARLCNSCGCSDWKEQVFNLQWTSNSSGSFDIFGN